MLLKNKFNCVAYSGIACALSLVFLTVASFFPFCKLAFVFSSSVICGLLISMYGNKTGIFHYVGVSVLALLLVPDKTIALLYAVVVGNYPVVKFKIDKIKNKILNFTIKMIIYNIYMLISYAILIKLLNVNFSVQYSFAVLWVGILFVFYVYDYIYTPFVFKIYNLIYIKRR